MPTLSVILLPDAPKFTILAVNNAYLETVKTAEKDLIGKGIFEAFPGNPEDRISKGVENLRNSLNFVIAKKDSHKMPLQKHEIPISGTTKFKAKYVNIQNIPIKDDNNNITHILHSIEDVTDKTTLEISLDIERQRFDDLYFQAPSSMAILKGPNHVYELANPLYLELIGVKDVIGKTVKEVLPEFEAQGILEILDTVYQTGETFSANEMLINFDHHGNGELIDTYLNYICQANRNNDGTIDGILVFASDVTELVLARKKTEESEKRYKELIQNLPIATYSCDLEGRLLLYNKAATTLWGGEPEIGKDKWCGSWKIYGENGKPLPFDLDPMSIAIKEGRKITDQEIIVEPIKGDKINVLAYQVPFMDSSGRVTGVVNMLIDITESKKAEKILRESEKRLNEAQEIAHLGSWELNFETGISLWSNEACKIHGLSPKDNKQTYSSWLSFIHPEDVGAVLKLIDESNKTLSDLILNFRIILKDGTIKYIYGITKFEFDNNQKPIGLYGITQDVTETTKAEKKVRFHSNLLNIISQAAISTNTNGIINFWNKAATELYGWTAEEALGKNVISLISTERKEGDTMEIMEELAHGNSSNEFVVKHKDGHTFSVFASISPIYGKQGKFEGTIEVSLDITGRKKEEEKLAKLNKELSYQNEEIEIKAAELSLSNKELIKINKELDRFVYSVSHDLRSPLTSILGLISFIEEDSREPDTLEQVKMIRSSINRLDGFIKNILSYSQNNRTGLETEKIPIKKTIHEIVKSVCHIKEANGISFKIDIDEQHPFYSDWHRFNTVLENLVSNAIKYHTKEVSGRYLKLTGTADKEELKLSISDNGIGIDPEFHDKIFEMFYRLPGNNDGSGVGLYIVKETLEKMQGSIEVQSKKGVGTTFNIRLKNLKV